jgi:hypothetical protein
MLHKMYMCMSNLIYVCFYTVHLSNHFPPSSLAKGYLDIVGSLCLSCTRELLTLARAVETIYVDESMSLEIRVLVVFGGRES